MQTSAHQPTPPHPRDAHTGEGGRYVRDPATGIRTRVPDAVAPAAAVDPLAAEAESGSTTLP
ncbi:hypothetical protein [Polaromonas sp. OV174]|uniref:hypothetical protein n=1 Tax=Polaromonas sp. OV174 TaxID=1855300 RepID=UPI001160AF50|nr:hypothetical protein [Polaromonas sp. OV174]